MPVGSLEKKRNCCEAFTSFLPDSLSCFASKKVSNNPGRLGSQIGHQLDAVNGKPESVKEADSCRDMALSEHQQEATKAKAYSREGSKLQQSFNELRKLPDEQKPIIQANDADQAQLDPDCSLEHVDLPLVVTSSQDEIIHNVDGPAMYNTRASSSLVIQRIHLVHNRRTGIVKLFGSRVREAFRAIDSYQVGLPYEKLWPYLLKLHKSELSMRGVCSDIKRDLGISLDHATLDVVLARTHKILAKIAAMLEKVFILSNDHAHMDETFQPFQLIKVEGDKRKHRETYYVLVVTAARSSDFKGTIYKLSESRSEEDFNKAFGLVLDNMSALNSDRYTVYGALMAARAGLNGYCWAHLLREMLAAIDAYLEAMALIEQGYIDGLKKSNKYDAKSGLTSDQRRTLNSKLSAYWKTIPDDCQKLINATYCITQIFFIEEWGNIEWADTYAHSTTFAELGMISDEERKSVCDKVRKWREVSAKYFECFEQLVEAANLDDDSQFEKVEKAIRYFLNGKIGFMNFLKDPELAIDNNPAELKIKKITPLRKLQRINQNPQHFQQACDFHTCLQTLLDLGYTEESFSDLMLSLVNALFIHTLEQGAQQWAAEHDLEKSPLSNMIFFLNNDTYLDTFPVWQYVVDFLAREREKLREEQGRICDTFKVTAIEPILQEERANIEKAKSQPRAPLCPVAKSKATANTAAHTKVSGNTAKAS